MNMIFSSVTDNKNKLNDDYKDCSDFLLRECLVCGEKAVVCVLDGMINSLQLSQMIMNPLLNFNGKCKTASELFKTIKLSVVNSLEMSDVDNFDDVYFYLSSGFAVLFLDGVSKCLALGIQGFEKRALTNRPTKKILREPKKALRKL